MFAGISLSKTAPIYKQLVERIENMVLGGVLEADEELPSVRELAAELMVNPNTVQKAYSELERRKVTYSVVGKGRFVNGNTSAVLKKKAEAAMLETEKMLTDLKKLGLRKTEIYKIVDKVWRDEND